MTDLSGRTTIVVGASRGLGHGVAKALSAAGAPVVAVSRTATTFPEPAAGGGPIRTEVADAADATVAATMIDRYEPNAIVLVAGATPHLRPLQEQTWETFAVNWEADVRIAFHWLREILLTPLKPGSRVVVFSSGAALAGSPLSGGYAGAKATLRFITAYAQEEARRAGMDITFTAVMPRFAPATDIGDSAVRAYASRSGLALDEFLAKAGPMLTPELAGESVVDLLGADAASVAPAYVLDGGGLRKLS